MVDALAPQWPRMLICKDALEGAEAPTTHEPTRYFAYMESVG